MIGTLTVRAHHHHHGHAPRPLRWHSDSLNRGTLQPAGATKPQRIFSFGFILFRRRHRGDRLHKSGGLVPAIIQDERKRRRADAGFMNFRVARGDAAHGRSGVLQPLAKQALEERANPASRFAGPRNARGLRRRCAPSCASKPPVPASVMKVYRSCFFRKLEAGRKRQDHCRSHVRPRKRFMTGENSMSRLRLGSPKGMPQRRDAGSFFACWLEGSRWAREVTFRRLTDDGKSSVLLVRAQEMARYVESGALDAGITGSRLVVETGAAVGRLSELIYAKQRWRGSAGSRRAGRLRDPEPRHLKEKFIATEGRAHHGKLSRQARRKSPRGVFLGRHEVKVPQLADAIVELTETCSSLRANRLRIVGHCAGIGDCVHHESVPPPPIPGSAKKRKNLILDAQGAIAAARQSGSAPQRPSRRSAGCSRGSPRSEEADDFRFERPRSGLLSTLSSRKRWFGRSARLKAPRPRGSSNIP